MLCIGLATTPAPLAAQGETDQDGAETETQRFEDWTLRCRPASETQSRSCRIVQQLVAEDTGKPLLQILAGRFGPEKVLGAVIYVPLGVRLPPGLGIQVDERPLRVFPFERCDTKSCQARPILEGDLLNDLKAGLMGHVRFQDASGRVLVVSLSLKGFTAALRALP
jgi:invasion protein IalB